MTFRKWFKKKNDTGQPLSVEDLREKVAEYQQNSKQRQKLTKIVFNYINDEILSSATINNANEVTITERDIDMTLRDRHCFYNLSSNDFLINILKQYKDVGYTVLVKRYKSMGLSFIICWEPITTNRQFYKEINNNEYYTEL